MPALPLGDLTVDQTIRIPWETAVNGLPVTITGLAVTDIEIYKDGGTTQRSSDNGYALLDTDGIDFDGVVGLHAIEVDLSDNSDAGFYASGSDYWVVINAVTLSGETITPLIAVFSIQNRFMRGTDNAALASVLGALADAAATGDPTAVDTLMQYIKQLVNLLAGSAGIATMPAGVNPANGVNLFEMVRAGLGATFDTATDSQEVIANAIGALNDLSAAEVNTQMVDVITVDTIAELAQAAPTATPTVATALMLLYMALRNRGDVDTVANFKEFYNNAGTVIWKKALTDAGGIYSEATGVTGP